VPKKRVSRTTYECDGPGCNITTADDAVMESRWLFIRMPRRPQTCYHRVECAIAHLSEINNGFDAAIIRARIGQPQPAGQERT
jgi:hypothetical protein